MTYLDAVFYRAKAGAPAQMALVVRSRGDYGNQVLDLVYIDHETEANPKYVHGEGATKTASQVPQASNTPGAVGWIKVQVQGPGLFSNFDSQAEYDEYLARCEAASARGQAAAAGTPARLGGPAAPELPVGEGTSAAADTGAPSAADLDADAREKQAAADTASAAVTLGDENAADPSPAPEAQASSGTAPSAASSSAEPTSLTTDAPAGTEVGSNAPQAAKPAPAGQPEGLKKIGEVLEHVGEDLAAGAVAVVEAVTGVGPGGTLD